MVTTEPRNNSIGPWLGMLVLAQWPLSAAFLLKSSDGFSFSNLRWPLLIIVGLILCFFGRRPRWAVAATLLGSVVLTLGAFMCMREMAMSFFLAFAAGVWLLTAVALFRARPAFVAKLSFVFTILLFGCLAAEALVGRLTLFHGRTATTAEVISGGSLQGQVEIPDRQAIAQLLPSGSGRARKVRADGVVDFEVDYHIDRYGSRVVPGRPEIGQDWYLFGCSFTFGEGLEDGQTIAAQLQQLEPSARLFNFGVRNCGTSDEWIHLRRKISAGDTPSLCIYLFMEDHFRRTGLPDTTVAAQGDRPRVVVKNGQPVLLGKAENTIGSPLSQLRINLVSRSRVFSALRNTWNPTDETVDLIATLGQAMKDAACGVPGGRFIFVILPSRDPHWTHQTDQLKERLLARNVGVLDLRTRQDEFPREPGGGPVDLYFADGHPRAPYAALVARHIHDYMAHAAATPQPDAKQGHS